VQSIDGDIHYPIMEQQPWALLVICDAAQPAAKAGNTSKATLHHPKLNNVIPNSVDGTFGERSLPDCNCRQ
jgi:hypothetical protein